MDGKTMWLLGRAVEECGVYGFHLEPANPHQWSAAKGRIGSDEYVIAHSSRGGSPAEALTALLSDLGVEAEWPSEEAVETFREAYFADSTIAAMRRYPALVLALLEAPDAT